jgi:ribonuclease BN (tRNA processing enzyme)
MRATLGFHPVAAGALWRLGAATVRTAAANHPNGCLAYRIDAGGRSVVYATDTEHPDGELDPNLLALARSADVLIYDAQYTRDEYAGRAPGGPKRGWGHSTPDEGARLALAARVGQLILFHHDPSHDDRAVAAMEASTRALFPLTTAAREGLEIRLAPSAEQAA